MIEIFRDCNQNCVTVYHFHLAGPALGLFVYSEKSYCKNLGTTGSVAMSLGSC